MSNTPDEKIKFFIRIRKSTRKTLKDMGKKGETYDDVIRRLIRNNST
jgi:hypothetical protein